MFAEVSNGGPTCGSAISQGLQLRDTGSRAEGFVRTPLTWSAFARPSDPRVLDWSADHGDIESTENPFESSELANRHPLRALFAFSRDLRVSVVQPTTLHRKGVAVVL